MSKKTSGDVELGDEPSEPQVPLELKYQQQMRQINPQKIELPISTLTEMIDRQIELSPDFQRRDIWDFAKRSRFIESVIMNVPIPPVFLGEDDYGDYVVLDGRQRLTAVFEFLKNQYKLEKLQVWSELNGMTFYDLQKKGLDKTVTRRFIPAVLILKESSPEVKYDVFDRLNTGGVIAEPMEIRNAIYRGPFTDFIRRLSDNDTFRRLWEIPSNDTEREKNKLYSRMEDVELVLRFFALQDYKNFSRRFKDYLSHFMSERNVAYTNDPKLEADDEKLFTNAVVNSWNVFGEDAFRKLSGVKSAPLADAVMFALSKVTPAQLGHKEKDNVKAAFTSLMSDTAFSKAIDTGTNGRSATTNRLEAAEKAVQTALTL